jgi:hypothetical protein
MAYADPPYVGQAKKHYRHVPQCAEVDHGALIARLVSEFPDGWALSCSTPSLRDLLPLCPAEIRVMAWVKPFCVFKVNVNPAYAWEPVIVSGGRARERREPTVRDWVAESITLQRGTHGAKPLGFCFWLFEVLNLHVDDEFIDLYPGSGAVTVAWHDWRTMSRAQQGELVLTPFAVFRSMPGCDCDQQNNPDVACHASDCVWRNAQIETAG